MKEEKKEHLYYIDFLRLISVTAVIFDHSHMEYVCYLYWSVLMFTAISGAMMLCRRRIDIKKLYTHSISRIVTAFIFWSTVYSLVQHLMFRIADGRDIDWKLIITSIVEGQYHMWYCYMIVGLFILAPCIKAVIDRDDKLGIYLCMVTFVFSIVIPALQNVNILKWTVNTTGYMGLNGFRYVFYFVLGYYLSTYEFNAGYRRMIYLVGTVSLILYLALPNSPFMYVFEAGVTVLLFVAARYLLNFKGEGTKKVLMTLADASFAVYLVHDLFNVIYVRMFGDVHSFSYDTGKFVFTLTLSFISGILIRKCRRIRAYIS